MSLPREVPRGRVYLISRRTSERRFFLRPSRKIRQICLFCLAHAASRTGVSIHGFVFLSNHFHLVATDVEARLPEFMHWLDEFIAKCVNAEIGHWEYFWGPGSFSAVHLADDAALVGGLEYCFNNAVSSGLVARMKDWPGAFSTPADMARPPRIIQRPEGFFRKNGPVPETATLELSIPGQLNMTLLELERRVEEGEQRLRQEARAEGRGFLGRRRVLKQSPFGRPRTYEERRGIDPRVAAKEREQRADILERMKIFLSAYRDALELYVAGDRDVTFPYGTYGMRVRFGVACNGP